MLVVCSVCYSLHPAINNVAGIRQCSNYMEARVRRAPLLFLLPHRANAVMEYLGTEGSTLIFL